MYATAPKKMLIINILDILRKYTDSEHRLSGKQIVDLLLRDYAMSADRKSVKRNLMNLVEYGYPIECSETVRKNKSGEEEILYSDWYMVREFSDAELRLLVDSLLFSKNIPYKQCKELIEKLDGLSNTYFRTKVKHICNLPDNGATNKQLFLTIEVLDEAISTGRQVSFRYNSYDIDKKMHPRLNDEGMPRDYVINPYQIVATNGRYYLICNYDKYDEVSNYRIDRITDIKLLDTPAKSKKSVKGLEQGLNLPKHMAEHIYMFAGESGRVTFRAKRYIVTELIDWFGSDIRFYDATDDEVTACVTVNLHAMRMFAMQYALHITILTPQKLADEVKEELKQALLNYEK